MVNAAKSKESLIINLKYGTAIRSFHDTGVEERPLTSKREKEIEGMFEKDGKKASYIEATFYTGRYINKIEKLYIKYEDGSTVEKNNNAINEEEKPKPADVEKIVKLLNSLFDRKLAFVSNDKTDVDTYRRLIRNESKKGKDLQRNDESSIEFMIVNGKIIDPETGKEKQLTRQEIDEYLSYLTDLLDDESFIVPEDMLEVFEETIKYLKKRKR